VRNTDGRDARRTRSTAWQSYRAVLGHRDFALLWAGQTVSWFGDSLYLVALLWLVQEMTGSRVLMGVVAACRTIPALFGFAAGVFVDRLDRRRLMIGADLLRAGIVVAVPLLLAAGWLAAWHLPLIAFLLAVAGVPFYPAQQALLPALVDRSELAHANSLMTLSQQVLNAIGYGVGGICIALVGVGPLFVIDALTFVISGLAVLSMRLAPRAARPATGGAGDAAGSHPASDASRWRRWTEDLRAGLRFVRGQPALITVIPLVMLLSFLVAPFAVLLPAWVKDVLGAGPEAFGMLETAITVGMVLGSLAVGVFAARARRSTMVLGSLVLFGAGALAFAFSRSTGLSALVLAAMGCANTVVNVIFVTWVQGIVPAAMMGRVFGALGTVSQAIAPLGQALAGIAGHALALPLIFGGVGIVMVFVSAVYAATPKLRGAFNLIESDLLSVRGQAGDGPAGAA